MTIGAPRTRKFLCIGHPRCGTGYTAHLLSALGWDVGHECMGLDGISSWMLAVDQPDYPWGNIGPGNPIEDYEFETVIHVLRDPLTALPSIILDNRYAPERKSLRFRIDNIQRELGIQLADVYAAGESPALAEELELAGRCFLLWNRICERRDPQYVFRIELDLKPLCRFNRAGWDLRNADRIFRNSNKPYQGVRRAKFTDRLGEEDLDLLTRELREELLEFRRRAGYGNSDQLATATGELPT